MSFVTALKCTQCGHEYPSDERITICAVCDGVLNVTYDLSQLRRRFKSTELARRLPGIWKYSELLPVVNLDTVVSLGEGGTFLHKCDGLARSTGMQELYLKDETTNPTGAFIDRGTAVEVSVAKERGFKSMCCGSTGNLAASLVAYAARAGLSSKVFIPQRGGVDVGKFYQILAYGADVEVVRDHEEAEARANQESSHSRIISPSSPHFLEGVKTTVYEVCEQLQWTGPDWIIVPMGNGGHLSMIWKGLRELNQVGLLETNKTKLVGVQAKGCAPIVEAFDSNADEVSPCATVSTLSLDISVKKPSCGRMALNAIRESRGHAIAVHDKDILKALGDLARQEGVFAEPSSATSIAALRALMESKEISRTDRVVCVITGMGLKYPEIARTLVKGRTELENLLSQVEDRRFTTHLGKTKVHILHILAKGESYGYEIWKGLQEDHGVRLRIPSVYQHLVELKTSGLIASTRSERTFDGRYRRYYELSERGKWTLNQLERLSD